MSTKDKKAELKPENLFQLYYHVCKQCMDEDIDYEEKFRLKSMGQTKLISSENFSAVLEDIMGSSTYEMSTKEIQLLETTFKSESGKQKVLVDWQELCKELDKTKRLFRYVVPFFKSIKQEVVKQGIVLETYLRSSYKPKLRAEQSLPDILSLAVLKKIMSENKIETDNLDGSTVMRMVAILSEGSEAESMAVSTFKAMYTKHTGDSKVDLKHAQAKDDEVVDSKDCLLLDQMKQGKKTWAHQVFTNFNKFLEDNNHESLQYLVKEIRVKTDQRGFCEEADFEKLLRRMDPTLSTGDLEKLKLDLKNKSNDKYDTETLERCILRAKKVEKKLAKVLDKDNIMQEAHSDLQQMLKMITKYAIKRRFYFTDIFSKADPKETFNINYLDFNRICEDRGIVILPGMIAPLRKRYQNLDGSINYKRIDDDMIIVDPNYKEFRGADEAVESREPTKILADLVDKISKKFESFDHFCKLIDSNNHGYLTRKSLQLYFKQLDPDISDAEFQDVMKLVDPASGKAIKFYIIRENFKKMLMPSLRSWIGTMLNKFDETNSGLGMKILGSDKKAKLKYQRSVIEEAVKQFVAFDGHQFNYFLELLEVEEDYGLNINWKTFCIKLKDIMVRYDLRKPERISEFLSTEKLSDDEKKNNDSAKQKEETLHLELLSRLRQELRILNRAQAIRIFEKMDSNKSGTMVMNEFEDFVSSKFPDTPFNVLKKAYEFVCGGEKSGIKKERFADVLVNEIELIDRDQLLLDQVSTFMPLLQRINKAFLRVGAKKPNELFNKDQMKILEVTDIIATELKIEQTNDLVKLLKNFTVPGKDNEIKTEDLLHVLTLAENSQGAKSKFTKEQLEDAHKLAEELEKRMKNRKYSLYTIFNKVNLDDDGDSLNMDEFKRIITFMKSSADIKIVEILFQMVDEDSSGLISLEEFKRYFNVEEIEEMKVFNEKNNTWLKALLVDIELGVLNSGKSAQFIFSYKKLEMPTKDFRERLKMIRFDESKHPNFESPFLETISHEKKKGVIDLTKFQYLMEQYKSMTPNQLLGKEDDAKKELKMDSDTEIFFYTLSEEFQNDLKNIVSYYDPKSTGDIAKSEFVIKSRKLFKSRDQINTYDKIFQGLLNPGEQVVRVSVFKQYLAQVISKFSSQDDDLNVTDILERQSSDASFLDSSRSKDMKKSSSEVSVKIEGDLMRKLRKALNFEYAPLSEEFGKLDPKKLRKLHKNYVLEAFKNLAIKDLSPAEQGVIFADIIDENDMVSYLEIIYKLFPDLNNVAGSGIETLEDFVEQIKLEMKMRGVRSSQIYQEFKQEAQKSQKTLVPPLKDIQKMEDVDNDPSVIDETKLPVLSKDEFKAALKRKGLAISDQNIDKIFTELDSDRVYRLTFQNFKEALMKSSKTPPEFVLNKICQELASREITVEKLFKFDEEEATQPTKNSKIRRRKQEEEEMNFKEFADRLKALNLEIDAVDLETLFAVVDTDNSGLLSKEEILAAFKKFDSDKQLNLNSFRKAIYKYITSKAISLQSFYEQFDTRGYGKISMPPFIDMLSTVGFKNCSEDEVKNLFQLINIKKNFRLTYKELEIAYDAQNIITLFPFIKSLKLAILERIKSKSTTVLLLLREFDKDGDDVLNKQEFFAFVDSFGLQELNSESDKLFLFDTCNQDKDDSISEFELKEFLNGGKIIDICQLIQQIKQALRQRELKSKKIFDDMSLGDKDADFVSFSDFLRKKCGLKEIGSLEIDEVFQFIDRRGDESIQKDEFDKIFTDVKPLNYLDYNRAYFEKLSPRQKEYYLKKYKIDLSKKDSKMPGYLDAEEMKYEDELYELRKKLKEQNRQKPGIKKKDITVLVEKDHTNAKNNMIGNNKADSSSKKKRESDSSQESSKKLNKKESRKKLKNVDEQTLNQFADSVFKLVKKNSDQTFDENMKQFQSLKKRKHMDLSGMKSLAKMAKFKKEDQVLSSIFEFLDKEDDGFVNFEDLEGFISKYSLDGGDGSRSGKKYLSLLESAIIDEIKLSRGKLTLKSMFLEWTQDKDFMRVDDFDFMLKNLGLKKSIANEKEITQLFKFLDKNNSNKLSYAEFCDAFKDKKNLGLEVEESVDEEYEAFLEELRAKMLKKKRTPKELFYGLEDEFEGKIKKEDFLLYFEENKLSDDRKILKRLFEDCKREGTKFLDFKKFMKKIEKDLTEDKEEKAKNADKYWVLDKIKRILTEQYEQKKSDFFQSFERFDSGKTGFWKFDDFTDFIVQYQKSFQTNKGARPADKVLKKAFDHIDSDQDGRLGETEFLKSIIPEEYNTFLLDHFEAHHSFARRIAFKLKKKNYEDLFELLNTKDMEIKSFKFKIKMHDLGFDTDSKNYQRFQSKFEAVGSKNSIRINRINDLISALQQDMPLDSDQEEAELKKSTKFDRNQKDPKGPEKSKTNLRGSTLSKLTSLDESGLSQRERGAGGKIQRRRDKSKTTGPYDSSKSRRDDDESNSRSSRDSRSKVKGKNISQATKDQKKKLLEKMRASKSEYDLPNSSRHNKNLSEKFEKDNVKYDFDAVSEEIETSSDAMSSDKKKKQRDAKLKKPGVSIMKGRAERGDLKKTTRFELDDTESKKRKNRGQYSSDDEDVEKTKKPRKKVENRLRKTNKNEDSDYSDQRSDRPKRKVETKLKKTNKNEDSDESSKETYKRRDTKKPQSQKGKKSRQVSSADEDDSESELKYRREIEEQKKRDERIKKMQKEKEFEDRKERDRRRRDEEEEEEYQRKQREENRRRKERRETDSLRPEQESSKLRGSIRPSYPQIEVSRVLQPKKHLTEKEEIVVNKVMANIVNFMIEDQETFSSLFEKYDYKKKGFISLDDMESALYDDLNIRENENVELLICHYLTSNQEVNIFKLSQDLKKFTAGRVSKQKFVLNKPKFVQGDFSMYTREKLVNFKPPQRNDDVKIRNEDMIYQLRVHFSKVHKPPYKNRTLFDYFDVEKSQKIKRQDFLNQIKKADFKDISINDLDSLFDFLDHNNSGFISLNEFRYYFYEREFLEAEVKESALTGALEEDMKQLFSKIDSDGSGYIEMDEFITCLNLLGFIVTPEVIMMEFGKTDQNSSGNIDFNEFKHMMKTKLRKDLLKIDNRIQEIKSQLKSVHPERGDEYDFMQFKIGLEKMDFGLNDEEIKAVFNEINQGDNDTVHIDDFVTFMLSSSKDFDNMFASNAILKIKASYNVSLLELVEAYKRCPQNFCNSFSRQNFTALKNLPTQVIYPKLNSSNIYYEDLFGPYTSPGVPPIYYPNKPLPSTIVVPIKLVKATGVPIPEENQINRKSNITAREIRINLWNKARGDFVGNTLIFGADWDEDYEDRWQFNSSNHGDDGKSNTAFYTSDAALNTEFVLRFSDLKPTDREVNNLQLVFELVIFVVYKDTELQMSCGWSYVELAEVLKPGDITLPLNGGSPKAEMKIKQEDIRTTRKTLFGKMGKLFSKINSEIQLEVKPVSKLTTQIRNDLEILPKRGLFKLNSISMIAAFRSYLGQNAYKANSVNLNLPTNNTTRTFLRCMNIASVECALSEMWNSTVLKKIKNYEDGVAFIEQLTKVMHLLFEEEKFYFNPNDQTLEYHSFPKVKSNRRSLVESYLRAAKQQVSGGVGLQVYPRILASYAFQCQVTIQPDKNL